MKLPSCLPAIRLMSVVALGARGAVSAGAMRLRRRPPFAPEKVPNCGVMTAQGVVLERSCDQSPMNRVMCRSWCQMVEERARDMH